MNALSNLHLDAAIPVTVAAMTRSENDKSIAQNALYVKEGL